MFKMGLLSPVVLSGEGSNECKVKVKHEGQPKNDWTATQAGRQELEAEAKRVSRKARDQAHRLQAEYHLIGRASQRRLQEEAEMRQREEYLRKEQVNRMERNRARRVGKGEAPPKDEREAKNRSWRLAKVDGEGGGDAVDVDVTRVDPEVRSEFICPVCLLEMVPPSKIWQCVSGHILCGGCRTHQDVLVCPTCRATLSGRNIAMEKVALALYSRRVSSSESSISKPSSRVSPSAPSAPSISKPSSTDIFYSSPSLSSTSSIGPE